MTDEKPETIEISDRSNLLSIKTECPQCGDKYNYGVPYVYVPCKKCGITYRTDFKQEVATKIAWRLDCKISWKDAVTLNVEEKYYKDLCHIRDTWLRYNNWNLSEVTRTEEGYKYCLDCGVCFNCYTCSCGHTFNPDVHKKKQTCPECGSHEFKRTHFKKANASERNHKKKACPHCKSEKIKLTKTSLKTKCHLCSGTNLTDSKKVIWYHMTISRKGGYKL